MVEKEKETRRYNSQDFSFTIVETRITIGGLLKCIGFDSESNRISHYDGNSDDLATRSFAIFSQYCVSSVRDIKYGNLFYFFMFILLRNIKCKGII